MKEKQPNKGFTLVELLVVIVIISILILWSLRINLSRLSQKQETGIELIQIMNVLEEIRDNALIGRWVWVNLENPDSWKIEVSSNNWGIIESFTTIWSTDTPYANWTWSAKKNREILDLECRNFDESDISPLSGVVILTFDGSEIDINATGCTPEEQKILFIRYGNANISETLTLNTLTWVIERN